MNELELVVDRQAILGEGPCWYQGTLFWVDIIGGLIHAHVPASGENREWQLDQMIGSLAPRASGGLILALQHGLGFFDLASAALTPICDPEASLPENRFNDGKCDPAGRFWAGTMQHAEQTAEGALYVLNADLSLRKCRDNVFCSNGLAWSDDHRTMYYIDSYTRTVEAYDFDVETGEIENLRTVIAIPEGGGYPDGMTIDREGMLWVAQWGGFCVSRYNPATGACIQKIDTPCAHTSACTFGGPGLDELYITTARCRVGDKELAGPQASAGGLFKIKTDTQGVETIAFAG